MYNREKGTKEEQMAAAFYEAHGYSVAERNYRRKTGRSI